MVVGQDALGRSMPHGIVLGVALPPRGAAALAQAVHLAQSRSCPLSLVRVWEPPQASRVVHDAERSEESLLRDVAERAHSLDAGLHVTTHLLAGRPDDVLVSSTRRAALLVLAAPARRALREGRVLRHVTARASCPVVVVPEREETVCDRVVVGVDPDGASGPAVEVAFEEASRRRAGLLAVLAVEPWSELPLAEALVEQTTRAGERHLSESLAGRRERWPEVAVQELVTFDDPARALARVARDAHLLVVGRHERQGLSRLVLGSVSTAVLKRASCPVAVVRCPAPALRPRTARSPRPGALPGPLL